MGCNANLRCRIIQLVDAPSDASEGKNPASPFYLLDNWLIPRVLNYGSLRMSFPNLVFSRWAGLECDWEFWELFSDIAEGHQVGKSCSRGCVKFQMRKKGREFGLLEAYNHKRETKNVLGMDMYKCWFLASMAFRSYEIFRKYRVKAHFVPNTLR